MSEEVIIAGTFDTDDTAADVARAINRWSTWIMEGDVEDVPEIFEDLGLSTEDYVLVMNDDVDWDEQPRALSSGTMVFVMLDSSESVDIIQELVESFGAYEVGLTDDAPEELYSRDDDEDELDDEDEDDPVNNDDDEEEE